jgi:hypothetical protein
MDLLKLLKDRSTGYVRITFAKNYDYDLKAVMARVGLPEEPSALSKVSRDAAVDTMTSMLWRDLAYSGKLIEKEQAHQRAVGFIGEYAAVDAEFYNNLGADIPNTWSPLSSSTFDLCLLIVNSDSAICVLAEDED